MGLQSMIQWLLPKEDKFYAILEKQGNLTYETAKALSMFSSSDNVTVSDSVQKLEHDGDALVILLEEELAKTFVTPIDREDIHNLSIELDDVIDFCNQAARAAVLFQVTVPTPAMSQLANTLVKCTEYVSQVMPALRKANFAEFHRVKGAIKELEKAADKVYRSEITRLVTSENDFRLFLSQKEVLDKLENAVDRCEDISQLLVNLAVKHG